jgi:hypothetical protein
MAQTYGYSTKRSDERMIDWLVVGLLIGLVALTGLWMIGAYTVYGWLFG